MWDSQGNLGRLEKAGMSPFKGAASSSWRTLLLLQLVTNHRKKELAQGRVLGGPMREKGRDLGKGRTLRSCKMPHPPRPLGSWDLSLHFLRALVFAISRIAHPTDPTLVPPQIIIPHPITMGAQLGFKDCHPHTRICRPAQG